jgi:hypothetical protein
MRERVDFGVTYQCAELEIVCALVAWLQDDQFATLAGI